MMANADKCHLLSSVEDHKIEINGFTVKNSYYEKLSGVQFDDHIKFDFYIEKLCKKANRKLHALARVSIFMDLSKKRMLMSVFFDLQCNHLRLIWLCYSRNKLCHKISRLHGKYLHLMYIDKTSSYEKLLSKDGSASMHHKNLPKLSSFKFRIAIT